MQRQAVKLKPGDQLTVLGRCTGKLFNVTLRDCEIVKK